MNIPESILMIRSFKFNFVGVFRQGIVIELFNKKKEIKIIFKQNIKLFLIDYNSMVNTFYFVLGL